VTPYYEEAGITIYHGDCREILPQLGRFDLLLTDPPYGIELRNGDVDGHRSDRWNAIAGDEDQSVGLEVLAWADRELLPTIVFASPWLPWPGEWRNLIVWDKGGAVGGGGDIRTCLKRSWELIQVARNPAMAGQRAESVWRFPIVPQDTALHIAQKPLTLLQALLKQFGGASIVDPFAGSGSSLVAAKNLGYTATGIELEERYCEIAANRLRQSVLNFEAVS
jgi:site-specific DNA-methyltransferase (adenine-specific)